MVSLPEDTPLGVVVDLIDEAELQRAQQIELIACLTRTGQDAGAATRQLHEIEDTLVALRYRRDYLRAMQSNP